MTTTDSLEVYIVHTNLCGASIFWQGRTLWKVFAFEELSRLGEARCATVLRTHYFTPVRAEAAKKE